MAAGHAVEWVFELGDVGVAVDELVDASVGEVR